MADIADDKTNGGTEVPITVRPFQDTKHSDDGSLKPDTIRPHSSSLSDPKSQARSFFRSVGDWFTGYNPSDPLTARSHPLPFEQRTYGLPGSINSVVGTVKAVAPTLGEIAGAMGSAGTIIVGLGVAADTLKSFTGKGASDAAVPETIPATINLFAVQPSAVSLDAQSAAPPTVGPSPFAAWSHMLPSVVV